MKYYDNTRLSDFKTCPRRFYLRHRKHLVPIGTPSALIFGLAWHEGMNAIWGLGGRNEISDDKLVGFAYDRFVTTWIKEGMDHPDNLSMEQLQWLKAKTPMIAREMFWHYVDQRRDFIRECEILSMEEPFAVEIDLPGIRYIGRLDKVIKHKRHGILIIEHKTTGLYSKESGIQPNYIKSWSPNSQVDGYLHAAHMNYGKDVRELWIDAALTHKTVHDKFKFIPVSRQFAALDAWLEETKEWINAVERADDAFHTESKDNPTGPLVGFPKNTGACDNFAGCSYRDVCKFIPNPVNLELPTGYKVDKWEPFDILHIEKLGLEDENNAGR
jgi:hypothetical protein